MGEERALNDCAGRMAACSLALVVHDEISKEEFAASMNRFIGHRKFLWEAWHAAKKGRILRNDSG